MAALLRTCLKAICVSFALGSGNCEASQASSESTAAVVTTPQIIVLGELHGTNESPAFAQRFVNAALESGQRVVLGIETDEQTTQWLQTAQPKPDCMRLLQQPFWARGPQWQDGRTSTAMAQLWCWAVDYPVPSRLGVIGLYQQRPDTSLAALQRQLETVKPDLIVLLMGSAHAQRPGNTVQKPKLVDVLSAQAPGYSLRRYYMAHGGGTAWNCQTDCNAHPTHGMPQLAPRTPHASSLYPWSELAAVDTAPTVPKWLWDSFDGIYWLPQVSDSKPFAQP